jgi:hypothetical protein
MKTRRFLVLVAGLIAAALVAVFGLIFSISDRSGTAKNVAELEKVYKKAGYGLGSFYTNSVFRALDFTGAIAWRRGGVRPFVELKGSINTLSWKKFSEKALASELASSIDAGRFFLQYGHRVGERLVITYLSIDLTSGDCTVVSAPSELTADYYKVPVYQ